MAGARLRIALDANVLIAGTRVPRWPYEVMGAALLGDFEVFLPSQVIDEARRHVRSPDQRGLLDDVLDACDYAEITMPSGERAELNMDLVRDPGDVPIALALLDAGVEILVTHDKDFTDPGATAERFSQQVRVVLPAVFLREIVGWSSDALEAIRNRGWDDMPPETSDGEAAP